MAYHVVRFFVFLLCFGLSLYALSGVQFDKFVNVKQPNKAVALLFLLSLALAYLTSQALLELTVFNGLGG